MKTRPAIWAVLFATAVTFVPATHAQVRPTEPLRIGNRQPLVDIFQRKLDGPAYSPRARVDFFTVQPDKPDVFLTNTYVGANATAGKGYFSMTIPGRLPADTVVRAVAYDAATTNDATFYRSATGKVQASGRLILDFGEATPMPKFGTGTNAMAAADQAAFERLLAANSDTDGDGMSDWKEVLAGTDMNDPASLLAFEAIESKSSGGVSRAVADADSGRWIVVQWQARPGQIYLLQYAPSLVTDSEEEDVEWLDIGRYTAQAGETSIRVSVELDEDDPPPAGHFRVKLVY